MTEEVFPLAPDVGQHMGEGEMPARLDSLNWNTVVWGGLWVLVYGAWPWVAILFGVGLSNILAGVYLSRLGVSLMVAMGAEIASMVIWYALLVMFAYRANRTVWERERHRVAREGDNSVARPAISVDSYVATQRKWFLIGLAYLAFSEVVRVVDARTAVLRITSLAGAAIIVVTLLGLFAYERLRSGRPAPQS